MRRIFPALLLFPILAACDKPLAGTMDAGSATPAASTASSAASSARDPEAGAATPGRPTGKTVDTPAGLAAEVGTEIQLAGKPLYPPPACPTEGKDGCAKVKALRASMDGVKLLRHFDGPGGPKSILLLQVTTTGNTCNGGPLFFVRVAKDVPPQYSDVFDHCGGPDPMVGAMPDKILINVPSHASNQGTGMIAGKAAEYDIASGKLSVPSQAKKK